MRNLKKVLSLTLALVMMLGMMTFAGAAQITSKDLTDMNDVKNKEAVTLLVDLGIIAGRDNGKFDPMGTLTRAEFAKMIYVAKMGADDKALNFVGAATGLTDTKMWAEGYINYCFSTGIVAGRSATIFDPEGKVKTVEAAKMLLVALGFDSEAQGYIKDSLWSVNVMQDAKKIGLMAGIKDAADVSLSRDSAAQMIYNALFARTVTNERQKDFTGKWYVSKTTENATTLGMESFNLVKVVGKVDSSTDSTTRIAGNAEPKFNRTYAVAAPGSLGKTITLYAMFDYTVTGNTVTYGNFKKLVSAQTAMVSSSVLGTSVDGTVLADLKNPSEDAYIATLDDVPAVEYYYNGAALTAYDTVSAAWSGLGSAGNAIVDGEPHHVTAANASATLLGNGVVVTFLDNDTDGKADVVDIASYIVAKVTAYSTKDKGSITFDKNIDGAATFAADKVVGFDTLAKGDYVTLTVSVGKVTAVKATTLDGKITSKNTLKETVVIDGKTYQLAEIQYAPLVLDNLFVGKEVSLVLDANNYIIAKTSTTVVSNENYVYITMCDATSIAGTMAKAIFSDGTAKVISVKDVTDADDAVFTKNDAEVLGAHTFTVKDDKYTLSAKLGTTLIPNDKKDDTNGTVKYTAKKGFVTIASAGAQAGAGTAPATDLSGKYANSATLYVDVANGKTYTGYNALPTTLEFTGGTIVYATGDALMKIVYMTSGISAITTSSEEILIADVRPNETVAADGTARFTYTASVNGVIKEIVLDKEANKVVAGNSGGKAIYAIDKVDSDGVITALHRSKELSADEAVVSFADDTLVYNTDVVIATNADTIYVEVNASKNSVKVVNASDIVTVPTASMVIVTPVGDTGVDAVTAKIIYIIK